MALAALTVVAPSRGMLLLDRIEERFWNPSTATYIEWIDTKGNRSHDAAFAWDMGVLLSARAAAIGHSEKSVSAFDRAQRALQKYWTDAHGVGGYSVWPGQQEQPDRYYDDNAWIGLAQVEAFERSGKKKYLDLAKATYRFVISGKDSSLGGGIYWREQKRESKNTCVNAPAALLAAKLYSATRSKVYLGEAESLYAWTSKLRDKDGLCWDNISLKNTIGRTKWTYNSALMIRAGLALYKVTKQKAYLEQAVATAKSAAARWIDGETGAIKDEGPFAHHLAEAFLLLIEFDQSHDWRALAQKAIKFAYSKTEQNGLYGLRWDRFELRENHALLLYQASMARALLMEERALQDGASDG